MRGASRRRSALLVVLALVASACSSVFGSGGQELQARFASTFNLFEGSKVRIAGVDVGQVSRIDVPEGADAVDVTMTLRDDVVLPAGVRAVIVPEALLGERYIQLDPPYRAGQPRHDLSQPLGLDRTGVPTDFDEVLDSLKHYLEELPEEEVARLVTNLAGVLDGQGEDLGRTLENLEVAIDVLRENDDELIRLASHLADLNAALNTRNEELGEFIEDANVVVSSLSADRERIEAALGGVARMTRELGDVLADHRGDLERDVATVTRVGRTAVRNLEEIDRYLFWSAELYRHAERVIDRDENWLPLTNNFPGLSTLIADRVEDRIVGLCLRLGVDCTAVSEQFPDRVCFDPVLPCGNAAEPEATVPLGQALSDAMEVVPELEERLRDEGLGLGDAVDDALPDDPADEVLPDDVAPGDGASEGDPGVGGLTDGSGLHLSPGRWLR